MIVKLEDMTIPQLRMQLSRQGYIYRHQMDLGDYALADEAATRAAELEARLLYLGGRV